MKRPRIAVFASSGATVINNPLLTTSRKAYEQYELEMPSDSDRSTRTFDALRPQRLAAPAVIYVEQFTAHPLETDVAELYAPPDGYVDEAGQFSKEQQSSESRPVYRVELRPEDGLYPLPYMARKACGEAWDSTSANELQTFLPSTDRLYEEIDRFGLHDDGSVNLLSSEAEFDHIRAVPSGGYTKGLKDRGVPPERLGEEYFPYIPKEFRQDPPLNVLMGATNLMQRTLSSNTYLGAQWLESSPTVHDTVYWLNLVIDTDVPIVGHSAQRRHSSISGDGPANILAGVRYIVSRAWADGDGRDLIGGVLIVDNLAYSARDVAKVDARPGGGYVVSGGHGGIVADLGGGGMAPSITYVPARKHTSRSSVRMSLLPGEVNGVQEKGHEIVQVSVQVKNAHGDLEPNPLPKVTVHAWAPYLATCSSEEPNEEAAVIESEVRRNLQKTPLAGLIYAGSPPYGTTTPLIRRVLSRSVFSGFPIALTGLGNPGGRTYRWLDHFISADNLTVPKARLLLIACLLKFGAPPPARDPFNPTAEEVTLTRAHILEYQKVFDEH